MISGAKLERADPELDTTAASRTVTLLSLYSRDGGVAASRHA
jgi:hypothetical protein